MVYTDAAQESGVIRTFSGEVEPEELIWHRDQEDRIVESIAPSDWKIQLDDRLPIDMMQKVFIKRGEWHRLIKGTGSLTLKITKLNG
jgi:hypothetical protein